MPLEVLQMKPDEWARVRDLRLASLQSNPEAFGSSFETESQWGEAEWRGRFDTLDYLVAAHEGSDIALLSIERLEGDFGATCWIGECWSRPEFRGRGALRALFNFIDERALTQGWTVQGLGVWCHNGNAIVAYEKLGFVTHGENVPSTRRPGLFYQRMIRSTAN